jgi:ADP-ribose pyrophosphatase YjhB (NUDIX family)
MIDSTWYQRPKGVHKRISAGGIVIRLDDGRPLIALVQEGDFNDYILPKGGVKRGETPEAAARREIAEESGIFDLTLLADLGTRERLSFNRKAWIVTHYFLYRTSQTIATPTDRHRVYRCAWFPLHDLPAFFWPDQKALIDENLEDILRLGE